jgi:hypothetical protein
MMALTKGRSVMKKRGNQAGSETIYWKNNATISIKQSS